MGAINARMSGSFGLQSRSDSSDLASSTDDINRSNFILTTKSTLGKRSSAGSSRRTMTKKLPFRQNKTSFASSKVFKLSNAAILSAQYVKKVKEERPPKISSRRRRRSSTDCFCTDTDCSSASLSSCVICNQGSCNGDVNNNLSGAEYCTLGSICSRRSKATVKSRKAKGKRRHKSRKPAAEVAVELRPVTPEASSNFDAAVATSLSSFLELCSLLPEEVSSAGKLVEQAFELQRQFLTTVSKSKQPEKQSDLTQLLQPTADKIMEIQGLRENANRQSAYYNHLAALSESISALGWVAVPEAPGPFLKEMIDAGQFYTNRVLRDWKGKEAIHAEWTKSWLETLGGLRSYVVQFHTDGLTWNPNGVKVTPSEVAVNAGFSHDTEPIIKEDKLNPETAELLDDKERDSPKDLIPDVETRRNIRHRSGGSTSTSQPSSSLRTKSSAREKPCKLELQGKKWMVEYFGAAAAGGEVVVKAEAGQSVCIYKCDDSTIKIEGVKCKRIVLNSCKRTSIITSSVVSSADFLHCQSVRMQVFGSLPTKISMDKSDDCQVYLSKKEDSGGQAIQEEPKL